MLDLRNYVNNTDRVQTYRVEYSTSVQGSTFEVTLEPTQRLLDAFKKQYDDFGGLFYNIKEINSVKLID